MRVCFFGDSFVNGYGDPEYQGWVGRLCRSARAQGYDLTAYNWGIRRASSDDIKASWLAEASARLPREHRGAVVFSFGANDRVMDRGEMRVPMSRSLDNTRTILATAAPRWPTLFISSPRPIAGDPEGVAAAQVRGIAAICDGQNVPLFDAFAESANFTHWRAEATAGDGAHPGARGYEELAVLLAAWPAWRALLDALKG
ncbi:MAG: GDSL-type esterase/lipase family protein [Rhodospirillaceae bacterium]